MNRGDSGPTICEEKKRLLLEYDVTTQAYAHAMNELRVQMGTTLKAQYDRLFQATEEVRSRSEVARNALLKHIQAHHC